jgi:hypothetical protein
METISPVSSAMGRKFGAEDAPAREIELRLVVHQELLLLQRVAQAILQRHAPLDHGVHVPRIELEAIPALLLGVIHRRVGFLEEFFEVRGVAREGGDADARADGGGLTAELDRLAQDVHELARHRGGVELVGEVGQEHGELVAAEPRRRVRLPQAGSQAPRDPAQQPVAHGVPERVVDRLEAVEVHEQDGEPLTTPPRCGDRLGEAVVEERAVRQAGELVVRGQVPGALAGVVELQDHPVALERGPEGRQQQSGIELRFQQVAARAVLQRPQGDDLVVDVADHDHRNERRRQPRLGERGEPRKVGLAHVEQHHVGVAGLGQGDRLRQPLRVRDLEVHRARLLELRADRGGVLGVAAHEQDAHVRRGESCRVAVQRVLHRLDSSVSGGLRTHGVGVGIGRIEVVLDRDTRLAP